MKTLKYLALGILVGYLTPYLITLIKKSTKSPSQNNSQSQENN